MWWFHDSLRIRWRHAPQQIAVPFEVCTFGGFGEIAFASRLKRALRFEKFHVMLTNWMFSQSVWCSAKTCVRCTIRHYADPFHATLHCLHVRCTILHYAEPFHATLHNLCLRCTIRHYAEPFHAMLHHLCVRYTIWDYAEPFRATVHCFYARYTIRHYAKLFHVTLHRLCNVLQMSTKLFVIKLVYFTISCSNSTWATRLFIIWLNYSCLGCSVSWRKTKPSKIWQCHSFISYSILQLILKPAFYLLIYLTSLYKRLWRPPIEPLFVSLPVVLCQRRLTPPPPLSSVLETTWYSNIFLRL